MPSSLMILPRGLSKKPLTQCNVISSNIVAPIAQTLVCARMGAGSGGKWIEAVLSVPDNV